MRHVFEDFVVQEGGKDGGSLAVTQGTDVSLTAGEQEQPLAVAGVATKPCEATFRRRAVEVTSGDVVGEAPPPAVGFLEPVLPERFDVLCSVPRAAETAASRAGCGAGKGEERLRPAGRVRELPYGAHGG